MEKNDFYNENTAPEPIFALIVTECVLIILILAFVLCAKYFFKPTYKKIEKFYKNEFCSEITVEDFLNEI